MTLDEARDCLSVDRGASVEQIQEAFRIRAREVHPDRHPHASPAERTALLAEFDRARRARDALVQWARYANTPFQGNAPAGATHHATRATTPPKEPQSEPQPAPDQTREPAPEPPPRQRARPRTSESRRSAPEPERVTMRFDEFVAWTDAAGFSIGARSPRYVDWARIIVWSVLGALVAGMAGAIVLTGADVWRA